MPKVSFRLAACFARSTYCCGTTTYPMTSSITVAPPSALTTLAPGTKFMAGEPMKPATKSSGGASFSVSDMQEAGIDLFQRTEGGVRPVPHHTCHLSSKTFRPMKTVQRREQVLFLLIGCS